MKTFFATTFLVVIIATAYAQHSGNVVYGNTNPLPRVEARKLSLSDSSFIIDARVLINTIADSYVATIGISDTSANLKESIDRVNKRAKGFMAKLGKYGIKPQDVYLDMTTQSKLYDYTLKRNIAEQYLKGFEVKKNVVIKFKNIADLENIMIDAAAFQIYDLVKVDYVVDDLAKIHAELFKLAIDVINQKKEMYVLATNAKLLPVSQVYGEEYYSYYPQQLYKTYAAAESATSVAADYGSGIIRKDLKKPVTVYYDKIDYSGFDKIVNPSVTEPAIEFALDLQIKFTTEKVKR